MNAPGKLTAIPTPRGEVSEDEKRAEFLARLHAVSPLAPLALQILDTLESKVLTPHEAQSVIQGATLSRWVKRKLALMAGTAEEETADVIHLLVQRLIAHCYVVDSSYEPFLGRVVTGAVEPLIMGERLSRKELAEKTLGFVLGAYIDTLGTRRARELVEKRFAPPPLPSEG